MDNITEKLTVYFENPFWVGLFERISNNRLYVCKVTFGAEPRDFEVYEFINKHYYQLEFSPAVEIVEKTQHINPKRRQRLARKQTLISSIGTKSQQALQLQREKIKTERRQISKEQKEAEKLRMFRLKQQKKKEKHRGR